MDASVALLPLLLFLSLLFHGVDGGHQQYFGCKEKEREALLQFKSGVRAYGGMLSSWVVQEEQDCCRWMGVSCSNTTGHILKLHLPGNSSSYSPWSEMEKRYRYYLEGGINPSLLQLRFLEHLDLSGNDFSSEKTIPTFLSSFENLKYLNLSSANFSGAIPHQLGNLSNLQVLDLSLTDRAHIYGSCEWLSNMASLKQLALSFVDLSQAANLFEALNKLPSISYIDLFDSGLKQLPTSLPHVNFTMLKHLDLNWNFLKVKSSNSWLANLTSLRYLDLGHNNFSEFAGAGRIFRDLYNLETLRLQYCDMASSLDDIFSSSNCSLPNLAFLDLSDNQITRTIPASIGSCKSLKRIDLSSNKLVGSIPEPIGMIQSLQYLDLSFNTLAGSIPWSIGKLRSLEHLDLSVNRLNGSIPSSIGNLSFCKKLKLKMNGLSGDIPESLWQLSMLTSLHLGFNYLSGVLSEHHLSNMSQLQSLHLLGVNSIDYLIPSGWNPPFRQVTIFSISNCKVAREFPLWLQTQHKLETLSMPHSCVTGVLPSWIWNFSSSLYYLDLSMNMIAGEIPNPANSSLSYIDLSSNMLEGPLPNFSNAKLRLLNLHNNSLSGNIVLGDMENLEFLILSKNNISGTIPSSICKSTKMQVLSLLDNHLFGSIPACVGVFTDMTYLSLSNNYLSGPFPTTLMNCTSLRKLFLGQNRFSGELPSWIAGNRIQLNTLNLHSNRFEGSIPSNLLNLSTLHILDLSDNKLSGPIPNLFGKFTMRSEEQTFDMNDTYTEDNVKLLIKGQYMNYYRQQLKLVTDINLSGNKFSGEIPSQLGNLVKLMNLNLSNNLITGHIPQTLSNMSALESLDLSRNNLSGSIPRAMEKMSSLNHFIVSYNNLSGPIPTGGQFSTFPSTSYIGNPGLCGSPLNISCSTRTIPPLAAQATNGSIIHDIFWLYLGMAPGFVFGFWLFWGPLLLKKNWRLAEPLLVLTGKS